jgi:hypothetical protein
MLRYSLLLSIRVRTVPNAAASLSNLDTDTLAMLPHELRNVSKQNFHVASPSEISAIQIAVANLSHESCNVHKLRITFLAIPE